MVSVHQVSCVSVRGTHPSIAFCSGKQTLFKQCKKRTHLLISQMHPYKGKPSTIIVINGRSLLLIDREFRKASLWCGKHQSKIALQPAKFQMFSNHNQGLISTNSKNLFVNTSFDTIFRCRGTLTLDDQGFIPHHRNTKH